MGIGGTLMIGMALRGGKAQAASDDRMQLTPLIEISEESGITLFAKNPEIGQGSKTALPMIIAEELDIAWNRVTVRQADLDPALAPQFAGGSLGVLLGYEPMRKAGAAARLMLRQAAAARWGVPVEACQTNNGAVMYPPLGHYASYEGLAADAAQLPVPEEPPVKAEADFSLIGTAVADVDAEAIVRGMPLYGSDFDLPGCAVAVVESAPSYGATLESFDADAAQAMEGVFGVFALYPGDYGGRLQASNNPNFRPAIAVVATDYWTAAKARERLQVDWRSDDSGTPNDSEAIWAAYRAGLDGDGLSIRTDGDTDTGFDEADWIHTADYEAPFLAHVPMEPLTCTADATNDGCDIWLAAQNPGYAQAGAAQALGIAPEAVRVHPLRGGGGFGRRYYSDYATQAAVISHKAGRPVKLIWTREDDTLNDLFRPAAAFRLKAAVKDGRVSAWSTKISNASRSSYLGRDDAPSGTEISPYDFPAGLVDNLRYDYQPVETPIPCGQWRAVAPSKTYFATLSMLDELAHRAGVDPIEFYLNFIGPGGERHVHERFSLDTDRLRRVAEHVRALAPWGEDLPPGEGLGFAAAYTNTSFVAQILHARVLADGTIEVPTIWMAVDCGRVINRQGALAQVEGAVIEGLGSAMRCQMTFSDGAPNETNFDSYPLLRMDEAPRVVTEFVGDGENSPRGLGEPALPVTAPALANAVFAASGTRVRRLPVGDSLAQTT